MSIIDRSNEEFLRTNPGPFLARVVSAIDPQYMGSLQVQILNDVGVPRDTDGTVIQVRYLNPFYGITSSRYNTKNDDYNGTQKSYGFWAVPPDVGTIVMVIFIPGHGGFWMGCVQDAYANFMVPGLAATELTTTGKGRETVAEYNKFVDNLATQKDMTLTKKPVHPFQKILEKQGLAKDDTRGITSSSARRETPSNVFGMSTPGPVDRRPNAPTGQVGRVGRQAEGVAVSRLGGSTFVMDDGDDAFLRKTHAKDGPPVYVSVENKEKGGMPDIPHNELVRIRTRTGHQILLHNSEDLIYIANSRGTAWIELTSNGKIDIYAADSISMHTKGDFNLTADKNINMIAGADFNVSVGGNQQIDVKSDSTLTVGGSNKIKVTSNFDLSVDGDGKITVKGNVDIKSNSTKINSAGDLDILTTGNNKFTAGGTTDIKSGGNHTETAAQIHMNGPGAASASAATAASEASPKELKLRTPEAEPWKDHENLHGQDPTKYTTSTDTFKKIGK